MLSRPVARSDAEVVVAEVDGAPVVLKDVKNEILSMRGYTPSLEAGAPPAGRFPTRSGGRSSGPSSSAREATGCHASGGSARGRGDAFPGRLPPGGLEKALLQAGWSPTPWREQLRLSLLYRRSADAIAAAGLRSPEGSGGGVPEERNPRRCRSGSACGNISSTRMRSRPPPAGGCCPGGPSAAGTRETLPPRESTSVPSAATSSRRSFPRGVRSPEDGVSER